MEQLRAEPLCRTCKAEGRTTAATTADHVTPHYWNERLFWEGELQSMCGSCHSRKTVTENGGIDGN